MYTISEAAQKTGISAHTLRYYEKIGLLPSPVRGNGIKRIYAETDISFILFLSGLKNTGMSLNEISEFVKDGCIMQKALSGSTLTPSLTKRLEILRKHLGNMVAQRQQLDEIISLTEGKISIYESMLEEVSHEG
jgi:MerR family transcriptional regulator, aldehyde-responsive regulator